ncbi:MAG: hypothetical protein QGG58_09170 [Chloroflexota bacterium]|nr:hypothetical protein [Chloroflexota bacterium]
MQELLGNKALTVTRQYVTPVEQDLQDADRRANPGDHLGVGTR